MEKIVKDGLEMDIDTYKKVKSNLDPKEKIKIISDDIDLSENSDDELKKYSNKEKINYLSNIKDSNTGSVSKPFNIGNKKYQMVRGLTALKNVVMCVYAYDDLDDAGDNLMYTVEDFDSMIAKPFLEEESNIEDLTKEPIIKQETKKEDTFIDSLNLEGYKHFFVNTNTGVLKAKFKTTKDMIKSGIKLNDGDDYMDMKNFRKFRFNKYFKSDVNEEVIETIDDTNGIDDNKLQTDVKKLTTLIQNKFGNYLSKLDKPIEQAQFLTSMANEIGVPANKLSVIINNFKDIAKTESIIITKKQLIESLTK